ncbi:MAG: SPOR domain-containing protein [Pseudobdellovibrionaceae bacterium]
MSSKTDAIVKLAIVFFISLLSFSIGTFVGKKYSDNQHQLASLEPQKGEHSAERAVASEPSHEGQKSGSMTDEEIAKLAEEFVSDDAKAPTTETAHNAEPSNTHGSAEGNHNETTAKAEEPQHTNSPAAAHESKNVTATARTAPTTATREEPSNAAKNLAAGKTPAPEAAEKHVATKEERAPSSLPKTVAQFSVGKFTVQVAAYVNEGEAQKMASELKNKGYSAFYFPTNIKGKTWYRVSVGQFATQKEAVSYRTEFLSKSKVESAIIQKITE